MRATPTLTQTFTDTSAVSSSSGLSARENKGLNATFAYSSIGATTGRTLISDITAAAEL